MSRTVGDEVAADAHDPGVEVLEALVDPRIPERLLARGDEASRQRVIAGHQPRSPHRAELRDRRVRGERDRGSVQLVGGVTAHEPRTLFDDLFARRHESGAIRDGCPRVTCGGDRLYVPSKHERGDVDFGPSSGGHAHHMSIGARRSRVKRAISGSGGCLGVDDVDRMAVRERVDLAEHVVELQLPLVSGDIADVRSAHDVRQ